MSSDSRSRQKKPSPSTRPSPPPELTLTLITEQLDELLAQAEVFIIDAVAHILIAKKPATKNVPHNHPMWVVNTYRHMRLNHHLKKITIEGIAVNIDLIEKNTSYIATQVSSLNSKRLRLQAQSDTAKDLLSNEIGRLSLTSMKGQKQLTRLTSKIREQALSIEGIPLPEETRQLFRGIEASTRRLVLVSDSIVCAIDYILTQSTKDQNIPDELIPLKEEDSLSIDKAELIAY